MGKRNRQKAARNGHMKRFSANMVNAGKAANKLILGEYNARARTLTTPPDKANYSDNEEYYRERRILELKPMDVVLGKLKELWVTDFWQGYDTFNRICHINTPDRKLFLFFSGPRWFWVQETSERRRNNNPAILEVKRSIIYPDREIAMKKYYHASICWIEKKHVGSQLCEQSPAPKLHLERIKVI
jgi:hypothetical protein